MIKRRAFFMLMIFCFGALNLCVGQEKKHALIFAIGDYPEDSGWPAISSDNDTALIEKALTAQQFFPGHIRVVHDSGATLKGITQALDEFLVAAIPGDIDVIHFSCHGEQIEDLQRHKADGLEECIVPYDARLPDRDKRPYTQAYIESFFAGYYREDVFGAYTAKLRRKLGPGGELIVFLDCCHAGVGTRGLAEIRGGKDALVTPGFNLNKIVATDMANAFNSGNSGEKEDADLAPYVVLGAARANESDYETVDVSSDRDYGSLSYAISKALLALPEDHTIITYRTLFAQVQDIINDNPNIQHPVLAGTDKEKDRQLFGGNFLTPASFSEIDSVSDEQLVIGSGRLMGLDSGAKIGVYPAATLDPKDALVLDTGTVTRSDLFTSLVQFSKKLSIRRPSEGRVFVTESVYKTPPLGISIRSGTGSFTIAEAALIRQTLARIPGVVFSAKPELEIVKGESGDSVIIVQSGLVFGIVKAADGTALRQEVTRYMQDGAATVSVRLIPLIRDQVDSAALLSKESAYTFKNGAKFRLLITNTGNQDVYVNVLDLQPDGVINAILPNTHKNIAPEELLFPAHSVILFHNPVKISPPYGKEVLKIFVSAEQIDMEALVSNHGALGAKGNFGFIEKLVADSFTGRTRGVGQEMSGVNGSVYNLDFDIVR
jgi:hypothetical protein